MGRAEKLTDLARRDFLKGVEALALMATISGWATCALPSLALAQLRTPNIPVPPEAAGAAALAGGPYVTTSLAVVSAISSLMNKGSGIAKQMAALQLQLNQVLQNQELMITAIAEVQRAIDKLPAEIGGLYTNRDYREAWKDADVVFDESQQLIRRDKPVEAKLGLYESYLTDLERSIRNMKSLAKTADTKIAGVASMRHAGNAMLLFMLATCAMVHYELALPARKRWKDSRDLRYAYILETFQNALKILIGERIPEAVAEQASYKVQAEDQIGNGPWGAVFDHIVSRDIDTEALQGSIDSCLRSTTAQFHTNDGRDYVREGIEVETSQSMISFDLKIVVVANLKNVIVTSIAHSEWETNYLAGMTERGRLGRVWYSLNPMEYRDGDAYDNSVRAAPKEMSDRLNNDTCSQILRGKKPDLINRDHLSSEFEFFKEAVARRTQAILNQKVLDDILLACRSLLSETISLDRNLKRQETNPMPSRRT